MIDTLSVTPDAVAQRYRDNSKLIAEPPIAPATVALVTPGFLDAPRGNSVAPTLGIIGVIVLSILAFPLASYLILSLGGGQVALGGIMALIPLGIVFFCVRWIDRWDPEPKLAVVFAFLWGAVMAVILALLVDLGVQTVSAVLGQGGAVPWDFLGAVIQAPLVEELAKGLGLLVLVFVARAHFDGPVDGIVYAAWIAGGFAFTENILYFASELFYSGTIFSEDVAYIFFVRGVLSPFAHVMFTICTGLALGFVAHRGFGRSALFLAFFLGLIPAIALHAFWNGATYVVGNFYLYYAMVQVPLFVFAIVITVFLRRHESKITYDRLCEYANVGWFALDEIPALATARGRRQAMSWAHVQGKRRTMRRYIKDSTRLAFLRHRIINSQDGSGAASHEASLLAAICQSRQSLIAGVQR
ncbi:MAG: PrsW family intramembrane metalloprotease [Rhodoglobus sp.]